MNSQQPLSIVSCFNCPIVELAKSMPVDSLILSSHLFVSLPLFLFPFTVPCRIVFALSIFKRPNIIVYRSGHNAKWSRNPNHKFELVSHLNIDNSEIFETQTWTPKQRCDQSPRVISIICLFEYTRHIYVSVQ